MSTRKVNKSDSSALQSDDVAYDPSSESFHNLAQDLYFPAQSEQRACVKAGDHRPTRTGKQAHDFNVALFLFSICSNSLPVNFYCVD